MDSSRRAVESYWRSRMIDGATSDEDKVTPVYKLEEICDLLRSSHSSIVKEVSDFILRRLDHKSPIVKQKALRVIKYAVGKSGVEFRREMQRHSVAVRQLIHYKGQLDPLKGDALNKAVRGTAQEALSAIFSTEENSKAAAAPAENLTKRIQGFGNTNYEMPSSDDKKSFLSEVVGIGSATLKQGLNSLTQSPSLKKNDTGSYRSPNLRRSLTTEIDQSDQYEGVEYRNETQSASQFSNNPTGGTWARDFETVKTEASNGNSGSSYSNNNSNTREERLLETIVTSGGVRLQPTRDALHAFLMEASKLDALALSHALELKLQSHLWQVRVKAVCVLEAILRKKDDENLSIIASYFSENKDPVVKCSESPQASLREKANKVLSLLDGEPTGSKVGHTEKPVKAETTVAQMPDLIDTGDSNNLYGTENTTKATTSPLIDDLFGGDTLTSTGLSTSEQKNDDDPFADVSFHINNEKEHAATADLFTGLTVDEPTVANKNGPELIDIFGSVSEPPPPQDVNDLMAGMSINGTDSSVKQDNTLPGGLSETIFSDSTMDPSHQISNDVFNGMHISQAAGINANPMFPLGPTAYNLPAGMMFNPAFPSQPINYGALGNIFAQQQFLASMSNLQQLGNMQHSQNAGVAPSTSALPDIFNPSIPTPVPSSMMNSSKKEDTRAFDFISDHLAAARDPKRVI